MSQVKAISLWQPWATFMVQRYTLNDGDRIAKANETRSWWTSYRGPLVIHAAKYRGPKVGDIYEDDTVEALMEIMGYKDDGSDLPYGALLGIVQVLDCVRTETLDDELLFREEALGDYSPGRFAWITDPHKTKRFDEPIPYRGKQGLFNVDIADLPAKYAKDLGV